MKAPNPFHGERRITLSPHVAGVTQDAYVKMGVAAVGNALDVLAARRAERWWRLGPSVIRARTLLALGPSARAVGAKCPGAGPVGLVDTGGASESGATWIRGSRGPPPGCISTFTRWYRPDRGASFDRWQRNGESLSKFLTTEGYPLTQVAVFTTWQGHCVRTFLLWKRSAT
jgi:hypothetical protein